MEDKLNIRIANYFTESEQSTYEHILQLNDSAKLDEFYLLLIMKKLTARDQLVAFLQSLKKSDLLKVYQLVECIWSLSLFLESNPLLKNLHELIIELNSKNVVDRAVLMQKLSDKTLFECGFLEQQTYNKKHTRIMTRMRFEQNKYNLFREANEGYSKIALQLLSLRDSDDVEKVEQSIICLIGNFDLDPDRVIDLILDGFIQNSGVKMYIKLLRKFQRSSLPPLVCQRLIKIATESPADKLVSYESVDFFLAQPLPKLLSQENWTPNLKLLRVVALLIKNGLLKLDEVTNSLSPVDAFFQSDALRRKQMGKLKYNEAFVFNSEELTDRQKRQLDRAEKVDFFGQFLYSTKLWLMSELAEINDWQNFYAMWYIYGMHIDLITHQPILRNLFRLLDWSIDKVHQKISLARLLKKRAAVNTRGEKEPQYDMNNPIKQIKQMQNIGQEFFDQLQDILSVLKGYIGFCGVTYIKICRIFRKLIVTPDVFGIDQSQLPEYRDRIREIIRLYLLPGIAAHKCNPSLQIQLFQLLTLENFQFRYTCYLQNLSGLMLSNPYFISQFSRKKKQQNILFNTLSAEKKKQYFKKIAKLANNHPFCVFYWVTKRVMSEAQKESIPEIVNVLMNCTNLSMDVFVFVMLFSMLENRQSTFNNKMSDMAGWYRNCVVFFGMFYRKHPETDLAPVVSYVVGKLSRPIKELVELGEMQSLQLKVLKEILTKMAGVVVQEEANRSQLAAGPKMISQLQNISSDSRPTKKSKSELQNYFYERTLNYQHNTSLAFYIMVMITQKRSETIQYSGVMDVKLLAEVYDEYTTSFIQFVRMLTLLATDHQQFAKLLPEGCLRQLILTYKIPIELAFHIFRNSIKNTSSMSGDEWARTLKQVSSVMEEVLSENSELYAQSYRPNTDLQSAMSNYKKKFKKCITYELYSAFWLLNLDCVFYPQSIYDEKIEQLKKKISNWRISDKVDKELDKAKTLLEKIVKESEAQKRKYNETMEEANKHKILIDRLNDKKSDKAEDFIDTFAEMFSQVCILPRLLLQPKEALYCSKFLLMFVRANQLNPSRSVKLINLLLENVISYLQFATHRESLCITIFTTELLSVFANWNDQDKLKNDFLTKLGADESLIKDNYPKMKDYLLNKMFDRIILYIKSVKQEPYLIKNALYLLDKLDIIPAFKQQAEQLEVYMKDLKDRFYALKDMKPIIDRLISMLTRKKTSLPQRLIIEQKKKDNKNVLITPTTNTNNSLTSLDAKSHTPLISSTNGSTKHPQTITQTFQSQPQIQQAIMVESLPPPVQIQQTTTERHNNWFPSSQQSVSRAGEKMKAEREPFQNINSRQTPPPSKEQNTQPPKDSHKQPKQRQRELKFSNPNQQSAAILSNTSTFNKDIEKGEITTPTTSTQVHVPSSESIVAPAKLRTVKQVKQQQNKQKHAAKNIAAQPSTVLPSAQRLENQSSQGQILTVKETEKRDKDRDREPKQFKAKDHNQKDRDNEHNKDKQEKSEQSAMNKEQQKEDVLKRIKGKSSNPNPIKEQLNVDNTKGITSTQDSGITKQDSLAPSQQPSANNNTVSTNNPERQSKQSTGTTARRDERDRKDERRNDKDDRDRKEYDKINDRHDKKYYDNHRGGSRDNRRRSNSKTRNRR